jgi:hypothetical protein
MWKHLTLSQMAQMSSCILEVYQVCRFGSTQML